MTLSYVTYARQSEKYDRRLDARNWTILPPTRGYDVRDLDAAQHTLRWSYTYTKLQLVA